MNIGDRIVAWSKDEEIKKEGASGGLVTSLLTAALKGELVDEVIALQKKSEFEGVPIRTSDVDEVIKCSGSLHAAPINLTKFAVRFFEEHPDGTLALPAKPCDARGIIEQAKRKKIDLEKTYLIGLNCGGTMGPITTMKMLEKMYEIDPNEVIEEEIERGKLIFKTEKEEKAISIDELEEAGYGRRENCRYCEINIPVMADLACGNWGAGENETFVEIFTEKGLKLMNNAIELGLIETAPATEKGIKIREKTNGVMEKVAKKWHEKIFVPIEDRLERLHYYMDVMEDCIDCEACKYVCPVCACDESKCIDFYDPMDSHKISIYHLIRLLHLSDSCIGCGQCTDVCPAEIPLTTLHRRMADRIQTKYNYVPGMDMKIPPSFEVE